MRITLETWLQRLADLTATAGRPTTWLVCAGCGHAFQVLRIGRHGDGLCPSCYQEEQTKAGQP